MLDTQDGKRGERGYIEPNDLMEAMNSLGIDWNKSELYQTQPTQAREPEVVPNRSASGEWTALAQPPMPWLG